jgi:hypothetical protein
MDEKLTRIARRGCKRDARSPTRSLAATKDERQTRKREEEEERERERARNLFFSSLLSRIPLHSLQYSFPFFDHKSLY